MPQQHVDDSINAIHTRGRKRRRSRSQQGRMQTGFYQGAQFHDIFSLPNLLNESFACSTCEALKFPKEKIDCCGNKCSFTLNKYSQLPQFICDLFDGPNQDDQCYIEEPQQSANFHRNILQYNSSFACASINYKRVCHQQQSSSMFKIQGQLYHSLSSLYSNQEQNRAYGQLYLLTGEEAIQYRMNHAGNEDLWHSTIEMIQDYINQNSIMAQSYRQANQIYFQQEQSLEQIQVDIAFRTFHNIRTSNVPNVNEPAILQTFQSNSEPQTDMFVIYPRNCSACILDSTSPLVDPSCFPLFFMHGDFGFDPSGSSDMNTLNNNSFSIKKYYRYRLMIRLQDQNIILRGRRLTQLFFVSIFNRIEQYVLRYYKNNQKQLRIDKYKNILDMLQRQEQQAPIGRMYILPSSYVGGPRYMHQKMQNALSMVVTLGNPTFFLTMTCNPNHEAIKRQLFINQNSIDRPDIIARVFYLQVQDLMQHLYSKQSALGQCTAMVWTLEFQKRGYPHIHMLIWSKAANKLQNDMQVVDQYISAEIPEDDRQSKLKQIVLDCMIHGPCVQYNSQFPCIVNGKCSKFYPKSLRQQTLVPDDDYPQYRRRQNKQINVLNNGKIINNQWVVPYNPILLQKYSSHINVELVSKSHVVHYLFKYIHKGQDVTFCKPQFTLRSTGYQVDYDEIENYERARYYQPCEAAWRVLGFKTNYSSHTVCRLPVHTEGGQNIIFRQGEDMNENILKSRQTKLTQYFEQCKTDEFCRTLRYTQVPMHYCWCSGNRVWQRRKKLHKKIVSRLDYVNCRDKERFYLRLLLQNLSGVTGWQDLLVINRQLPDQFTVNTYQEAAYYNGLVNDQNVFKHLIEEALIMQSGYQVRLLFAILVVNDTPSQLCVQRTWADYGEQICKDIIYCIQRRGQYKNYAIQDYEQIFLQEIQPILSLNNMTTEDIGLQAIEDYYPTVNNIGNFNVNSNTLNVEQRTIYQEILAALRSHDINRNNVFFIDAPGGTGKTYLFNCLIKDLQDQFSVQACAWTGIAASLLCNGKTVHSAFQLPTLIDSDTTLFVDRRSKQGLALQSIQLWLLDEASMISNNVINVIDRGLREFGESTCLFGGKIFVFAGDFRQTLPIVPNGAEVDQINSCLKYNKIWKKIKKLSLIRNQRVDNNQETFKQWLLSVGEGRAKTFNVNNQKLIEIPAKYCCSDFVDEFYNDYNDDQQLHNSIILCPTNAVANQVNERILNLILSDAHQKTYYSVDYAVDDENDILTEIQAEYFNTLNPSGMPLHQLRLKEGCIVMLLRNLSIMDGLCNGTLLKVVKLGINIIECIIYNNGSTNYNRKSVLIPRIQHKCQDKQMIPFIRKQFPIKLAYCITINKAQGQSFDKVGVMLQNPVFSHGQLYVALSRVRSESNLRIQVKNKHSQGIHYVGSTDVMSEKCVTVNIVHKSVLSIQ